jgi:hypothetical protein
MIEMIDSLSLESGALVIAVVSGILAVLFSFVKKSLVKWLLVFSVPFFLSYFIYWSPVWFGSHPLASGEYSSWAGLFIISWYGAGLFASVLVCALIAKTRKQN